MASLKVNDAGTWKAATPWVNDAGTWKKPKKVWVNDAGTWKQVWADGPTFTPVPGSYSVNGLHNASQTVTSSDAGVWTFTKTASITSTISSGQSASSIVFSLTNGASNTSMSGTVNLTFTLNGTSYTWTIDLSVGVAA